jgi:hypothetical protein
MRVWTWSFDHHECGELNRHRHQQTVQALQPEDYPAPICDWSATGYGNASLLISVAKISPLAKAAAVFSTEKKRGTRVSQKAIELTAFLYKLHLKRLGKKREFSTRPGNLKQRKRRKGPSNVSDESRFCEI